MPGTGLASIISALSGAAEVVVTDYPTPEILANIRGNITRNLKDRASGAVQVVGHIWGDTGAQSALSRDFAEDAAGYFDIVLAADCLWMQGEHRNLLHSLFYFLSQSAAARVFVVAGFHTGRAILVNFLEGAEETGFVVEKAWERDVFGTERGFSRDEKHRPENATERSKWLMIAVLRKRRPGEGLV